MGYYDYDYLNPVVATPTDLNLWAVISIVVAIIGGIALYYSFLNKNNEGKFKGFLGTVYDFLNFKIFIIEDIVRIIYLILAIGITLLSFNFIADSFLAFIIVLILGNVIFRIVYEFMIMSLELCRNVREINKKTKK